MTPVRPSSLTSLTSVAPSVRPSVKSCPSCKSCLPSVLVLLLAGCLQPVLPAPPPTAERRPSAALVTDSKDARRYSALFTALANRTRDDRLQHRIELLQVTRRASDLAELPRGIYPRLQEAFATRVGEPLTPTGDAQGKPIPLTTADRDTAATALRSLARDIAPRGKK